MKDLAPHFLNRAPSSVLQEVGRADEPLVIDEDGGFDLRDHWRVLRKHRWLIVAVFGGTLLLTALVVFTLTPVYTAAATLLIERKGPQVLDIQQVLAESLGPDEYDYYRTQYEILQSRALASQIIREQGLEKNSLFTAQSEEAGLVAGLWNRGKRWIAGFFSQPEETNEVRSGEVQSEIINTYESMLAIKPVPRTRLVKVAFSSPDATLSAEVANAHARAYIRQGLGLRTHANEEAQRFLEGKLVELKERVEKSEVALNRYRRDAGIVSLDSKENIVVDRLTDLNMRLTEAEAERIALEAQARLISKGNYDSLPAVIESSLIQILKKELAEREGEYAQLSARFKSGYPRVAQLGAQVQETRRRLEDETEKVVGGIRSAYQAALMKEKKLRAEMDKQKTATLGLKDASVKYAILAREVDTNRELYDSVLQRMKEMGVAAEMRTSNVSVIDQAERPLTPSKPRKGLSLLLSAIIGLLGGVGIAFILEQLDNTLKTPEEVERYLGLPNLSLVPDFLKMNGRSYGYAPKVVRDAFDRNGVGLKGGRTPDPRLQSVTQKQELVLSHHPLSIASESYRALRTAILLSRASEPPRTILFTSGVHGEGKTSTTLNMAVSFAQMGANVLVIDADLRRPRCHRVLNMENVPGLTEVLTGQQESHEIIRATSVERFSLLSSGSLPPNPAELIGSKKMWDTLASLRECYDYILIDSPPIVPVSDAVLLSTMADGVVVVAGGQQTPKQIVREACARLRYARAPILGVVLNRVDVQSPDYSDYYGRYYSYYHHPGGEARD